MFDFLSKASATIPGNAQSASPHCQSAPRPANYVTFCDYIATYFGGENCLYIIK